MRTISKWSLGIGLPVGVFCLQVCIPSHARQPNPQEQGAPASQRPLVLKLVRKRPPLAVSDKMEAFHIQGISAFEALQYISRKYNVAIGMQGVVRKTDPKIDLNFSGGTVGDLLNAFVAKARDYHWQNDEGFIHISRNDAPVSLANVVLTYPGTSQKERYEIWRTLHTLPEYVSWMKANQCHAFEQIRPVDFKFNDGPIDIAPGKMTVAQLLDQVAKKSGDGFWAVLQSDPSDATCRVSVIDWSW
jgi:hypothetical protein